MSQRGDWQFGPIVGLIIVVLALVGLFAICTGDNGERHSLRPVRVASHGYRDCDPDWDDCGYDDGYGGGYGGYRGDYGGGGNGNRGRRGDNQRGDKNCHSICGNTIIVPDPRGGQDQPPPEER